MEPRHTATSGPDDTTAGLETGTGGSTRRSGPGIRHPFTIALFGEIDLARTAELEELIDAFEHSGSQDVDVDLTAVEFLDSTGLSAVSRLRAIAEDRGGAVRLLSPTAPVRRTLDVSGVNNLCEIID